MSQSQTIFLVDDDAAILDALGSFLRHSGFKVECFASGRAFLDAFKPENAGCVVLDLAMPGMDGFDVQQALNERQQNVPVIFMTAFGTVRDSVSAIKAGAFDFLEKPCSRDNLLECIREAMHHAQAMQAVSALESEVLNNFQSLSPREREIMRLISSGNTSKQIARLLNISPRTVDAHRARLMTKMQASSIAELGAMSARFLESPDSVS